MTGKRVQFFYSRFLAFLTILSLSFTQSIPAWALRPEGAESAPTKTGMEEALLTGSIARTSSLPLSLNGISIWKSLERLESRTGKLPPTTREIVTGLLDEMDPALRRRLPAREEVLREVDELLRAAPGETCLTCGTHAVSNVAFSSVERGQPEAFQSDRFNQIEVLTAVLILLDLVNAGRVFSRVFPDNDRVLANSMLSVRQALDLIQYRLPKDQRNPWKGARLEASDLQELLAGGVQIVAHLDGRHFVHVLKVEAGKVHYSEPSAKNVGGISIQSLQQFAARWDGIALMNGRIPAGRKELTDRDLLKIEGCCGINTVFGQYGGVRTLLDALLRLKYRAPDNTGIAVFDETGIVVRRVGKDVQGHGDGTPDTMIMELYDHPIYPEAYPLAVEWGHTHPAGYELYLSIEEAIQRGRDEWRRSLDPQASPSDRETARNRATGHFSYARSQERRLVDVQVHDVQRQGVQLFREESLGEFVPTEEEMRSGNFRLFDLTRSTLENLFGKTMTVQIGRHGGIWAGDEFLIQHDNLIALAQEISKLFGLNAEFVQLFLRAELTRSLNASHADSVLMQAATEAFDRLSSQAVVGRLKPHEKEEWDRVVMIHLVGRWLVVPSDFNVDVVRHVFRGQAALIGSMQRSHPEWRRAVEANFEARMPGKGQEWFSYWQRERDLNIPGHAFGALVDWFHEWAHDQIVDVWDAGQKKYVQTRLLPDDVYNHIQQMNSVNTSAEVTSPTEPQRGRYRRGYGLGTVNEVTMRLMGELIVGHGRWAMTGDPSRWNAHPHESNEFVVVHNGTIKGSTNSALKKEHRERGYATSYVDQTMGQEIRTDTRIIVTHWQFIKDLFSQDLQAGRVGKDLLYTQPDGSRLGQRTEVSDHRTQDWNNIVNNLRAAGRQHISSEEVAYRLALIDMADGSELGVSANTLRDPFVNYVVSHDRPVDIVLLQDGKEEGKWGKVLVTSDMAAGIALFPAGEVANAARQLSDWHRELQDQLDSLRSQKESGGVTTDEYVEDVRAAFNAYKKKADPVKAQYKVDVYHLKELNKFAAVRRTVDDKGEVRLSVDVSHFDGTPLGKDEAAKEAKFERQAKVSPDVGIKTENPTFIEDHVGQIPSVVLDAAVSYMQFDQGRPSQVQLPNLNQPKLTERFGPKLERLKRVFLVGVGSSWRDAKIVEQMFGDLLHGVEVVQVFVQDPVEIQNLGIKLNPETDLAIGMSWSGSTASMVKLFNRLSNGQDRKQDIPIIAVTGKPSSDMATLAKDSAGYVDVLSGPESSVATTKGFESVLYCLCLLGVQLSQLQQNSSSVDARQQYVQELWNLVDDLNSLVRESGVPDNQKQRSTRKEVDSKVQRVAEAWKGRQKVLVIGSRDNPVYIEGELKAEEIAWTVGKAVDIRDESWQPLLATTARLDVTESERVATIFNMTDPKILDEFMTAIREVTGRRTQVVVQTFREGNPHFAKLQQMEQEGRIALFEVPRVRTTLQALVDSIFFFQFAIAFGRAHGLTDPQLDNPRNLAKSVTVSGARALEEQMRESTSKVVTVADVAMALPTHQRVFAENKALVRRGWNMLKDPNEQAIARVPLLLQSRLDTWLGSPDQLDQRRTTWASMEARSKAEGLLSNFKQAATAVSPTARVLIITGEEATQYAGEAAVGSYGSREVVVSGEHKDLYNPDRGLKVRLGKWYHRASFDRVSKTYTLRFDPEMNPHATGAQPQDAQPISISEGQATVTLNGKTYQVDPSSFLVDKKDAKKLVLGLQMRAELPDLLISGVENIRVVRVTDSGIDQLVDKDAVVILVSRARNRGAKNAEMEALGSPAIRPRVALPQGAVSEAPMLAFAERMRDRHVPIVTIADEDSAVAVPALDPTRVLHLSLGADSNLVSVYPMVYLALLTAGVQMGEILGRNVTPVAKSLYAVPGLSSGVLKSSELRAQLKGVYQAVSGYKKVHIIGGGQAYADAKELARVLSMMGIFAEAQLNDSAWHGPLAADDPNKEKFGRRGTAAYEQRYGINGEYNTDGDVLVIFLGTDSKFGDSTVTDMQVYDSRNARSLLLTPESTYATTLPNGNTNKQREAIITAGPLQLASLTKPQQKDPALRSPEGVFTVTDVPDMLSSFVAVPFGMLLAQTHNEYRRGTLPLKGTEPVSRFVLAGAADVEKPLSGQTDEPAVAGTPSLPEFLQPYHAEVRKLVLLGKDKRVHFKAVARPQAGQAILMIIGPKDEPGVFNIITHVLDNAQISMDDFGTYDTDHAGLSYAVVPVSLEALGRSLPGKGSVLESIESAIARRYYRTDEETTEEKTLRVELGTKKLSPAQVDWLMTHYRAYHGGPRHSLEVDDATGTVFVAAMAEYLSPSPNLQDRLVEQIKGAVQKAVQEKVEELRLAPEQVPVFIPTLQFIHETEKLHPVVLVLVSLNLSAEDVGAFGVDNAIEEAVASLTRESQPPAADPAHQVALARGWTLDAERNLYRTPEGGWVSPESVLGIDPAAQIAEDSLILGERTRIGAGAVVTRSLVKDAVIGERTRIDHAVVWTDKAAQGSWSWNKTWKVDVISQTVIGPDVTVGPAADGEPAEIVNAVVGQRTKISGGFLKNAVIGADNILVRAKVVLTHTEDNVTLATKNGAPLEVSESWLGWGNRLDEQGYYEHLAPNFIRRAWVDTAGQVQFETVENIPAVVPQGFNTIDASYDGTGKVGKEFSSSRHGKGVKFPGAIVGPLTNVILHVHPDFESPEDLLRAESVDSKNSVYAQLTALHPFSFSHRADPQLTPEKAERPHGEVWGHVIPGASRYGLNTDDRSSLWVFEHARPAVEQILAEMHNQVDRHAKTAGWEPDKVAQAHAQVDNLPRYALETGKAMARLMGDSVLEHQYDLHLNNGGPEVEQKFNTQDGKYEVRLTTPGPEYDQLPLQRLLVTDHPSRDDWSSLPLFTPRDKLVMDGLPAGIQVSPDSKIGKNVTLLGARASLKGVIIPDGATVFLYDVSMEGGVLHDGAELRKDILRGVDVGEKAKLTNVRAEGSTFGPGDTASGAVVLGSQADANVTFEAYARVTDSSIGRDGIIGSPVWNSQFGAGITDHHLAARVRYVRTPDYGPVPNLTNISAGVDARGTAEKPIILESTMTGANMPIEAGVKTGFLSFVKGSLNEGQVVPPYTFSRGPDVKQQQKGYVLDKMQSMAMRFIGKTAKSTATEDRPAVAALVQQKISEAGLDRLSQSWRFEFTAGSDVPVFVGGKWEFRPRYTSGPADQGFGPNPTYVWIQSAGAEEKGTPMEGLKALLEYVKQENVIRTIALLAVSGKTGDVTGDFPALRGLAKQAGFARGVAAIIPTVAPDEAVIGVPTEYAAQGIPIFVKKEWESQVRENLSRLVTAGRIRFVGNTAEAFLVIGDDSVSIRTDQVFIGINEETVSQVTPRLLQELQVSGLLEAGSVVLLYKPLKESVLIFA